MTQANLQMLMREIRNLFEESFDKSWLLIILETLPFDIKIFREIREFLTVTSWEKFDIPDMERKILGIEAFISVLKRYLLPAVKERLGISYLVPNRMVKDKTQLVIRKFIAFTLPYNIKRLHGLAEQLKRDFAVYIKMNNENVIPCSRSAVE